MKRHSKILVTGGAGFIGSHLVDMLLTSGFEVVALDDFSNGLMKNILHHKNEVNFHLVRGDVRNANLVKKAVKGVDVVFHEAALVDVTLSVKHPVLFDDVNVVGTLKLLEACANSRVKRFIYASSAAVYGDSNPSKKNEKMLPGPISPYGASKLAAENYVQAFYRLYGLETVSLRYFNVYGPRQASTSSYGGVIPAFVYRLLNGQPLIIQGDGRQTRDFVDVDDVVSANLLALESDDAVGEVFNVASGTAITVNQLSRILQQIMNKEHFEPIFAEKRPGDIKHCWADISKAERLLGFHPKIKITDGLMKLVREHQRAVQATE